MQVRESLNHLQRFLAGDVPHSDEQTTTVSDLLNVRSVQVVLLTVQVQNPVVHAPSVAFTLTRTVPASQPYQAIYSPARASLCRSVVRNPSRSTLDAHSLRLSTREDTAPASTIANESYHALD